MKPVNSKSLFATLCTTLKKLDSAEIDVATASATSKLCSAALGYLTFEIKRATAMSDPKIKAEHRNIEMKTFDSLPE